MDRGELTSRRYDGMSVDSTSMSGVDEKQDGFDSAAVAIITEDAPREQSDGDRSKRRTHPSASLPAWRPPILYSPHSQ